MAVHTIHTTVNLNTKHTILLNESSLKLNIKRSKLVVLLLRKLLANWKHKKCEFMSVKYQRNTEVEGWKKAHVFFEPVDYEVFTDMRNCFKWSVSALLAMAISKYLNEILSIEKKYFKSYCDNYRIHGYARDGKLNKNDICWHIIWKLDEKFAKKLHK